MDNDQHILDIYKGDTVLLVQTAAMFRLPYTCYIASVFLITSLIFTD